MKKINSMKILVLAAVAMMALSCKNGGSQESNAGSQPEVTTENNVSEAPSGEAVQIDTLLIFDHINGMLSELSGEQFWSKDLFTPDYYEICRKLNEFSDGDSLWELGSIQEVVSVELTDISEFKMEDYAHVTAEALLKCKDIDDGMSGSEFRTLSLVLRDGIWLIDDVGFSKQEKEQAVADHDAGNK